VTALLSFADNANIDEMTERYMKGPEVDKEMADFD
jgi:hypothetical protein